MLIPTRFVKDANGYRYGFQGQEKDDEIKDNSNSYDFGKRIFSPRIGRWFSTDNINKPSLSQYQFSANNPINYVDPDGNDEIHFYYVLTKTLMSDGSTKNMLTLSVDIIKNNEEHTFYVHNNTFPANTTHQFFPFMENRLPNQTSTAAADNNLPLSQSVPFFFGLQEKNIDDHAYLGRLLQAAPQLMEHYSGKREDGMRFYGAVARAGSIDFAEKMIEGSELAYAILDGYLLVKGLSKFAVKEIGKESFKIAKPSLEAMVGQTAKLTINKNSHDAIGHFILYEVFDKKTKEILKVGVANADDVMANGAYRRAHTSKRLAIKEGYTNASVRVVEDLGVTTKGLAKQKEAARTVRHRKAGKELPLNREKDKSYHVKN